MDWSRSWFGVAGFMRMVKDEEEIACIRRACEIADRGYSYILGQIRAGMTEKQVENRLLYYMKELGAQKESFDIIVASGVNGSMPHAKLRTKSSSRRFVTMTSACGWGNTGSDITRTVVVEHAGAEMRSGSTRS